MRGGNPVALIPLKPPFNAQQTLAPQGFVVLEPSFSHSPPLPVSNGGGRRTPLRVREDAFICLQRGENLLHYAVFRPTVEFPVYCVPLAEPRRQCPPFAVVFGDIQDSVDEIAVVGLYVAALNGKIAGYSLVLFLC